MAGLSRFHLFLPEKGNLFSGYFYFTTEKVGSIFGQPLIERKVSKICCVYVMEYNLRPRQHDRQLIPKMSKIHDNNFIIRMLYKDVLLTFLY